LAKSCVHTYAENPLSEGNGDLPPIIQVPRSFFLEYLESS
jgi:hypothetical protein